MDERIKIAIIAGQLVIGGAERQLYLWLTNLDRARFEPVVITLHPGCGDYWEAPIEALGIPLVRIPHERSQFFRLLKITRALLPFRPQLIHGWHRFSSLYAAASARLLGARSLGGIRHSFAELQRHPLESRLLLNQLDGIIVNSCAVAHQLETAKMKSRVFAVQNAVDIQVEDAATARRQISQRFGITTAAPWLGSVGRLERKKGFDMLLQTMALFKKDYPDFHFLLVGDGPDRQRLEKITDELGLRDCTTFLGEVPGASTWISALDIFCFMSLDEGLPNVILEAAAAALPVAAWRAPFIEEILEDKKMALLAEPGDTEAFRQNLLKLCLSAPLRHTLGQSAQAYVVEKFSLEKYSRRMSEVYEAVLQNR